MKNFHRDWNECFIQSEGAVPPEIDFALPKKSVALSEENI
jgi:hypothetical protein